MDELITSTGISLDLKEGIPVPINLSIFDFKEPDKRQRNFSKETELPDTAKNRAFFSTAFNLTQIQGVYDFNSSAKVNCTYYKRGQPIMRNAVIKLNKVIIRDKVASFRIGFYADFVDIYLLLANTDVRDLPWGDYTHTLTKPNISGSWSTPLGTGYYYPLVERNQRMGIAQWKVTDMVPYVHLVDVFQRCMDLVGQKFTSVFLATIRAKSVIFGYGGGNFVDQTVTPVEQNNRKVLLSNGTMNFNQSQVLEEYFNTGTSSGSLAWPGFSLSAPQPGDVAPPLTITETQDIYNQFIPNKFTAQRSGSYKITINGSIRQRYTAANPFNINAQAQQAKLAFKRNGVQTDLVTLVQNGADNTFPIAVDVNVTMNAGDEITFLITTHHFLYSNGTPDDVITRNLTCPAPLAINFTCLETSLAEGSTVEIGRFLPSMKCNDLIIATIRHFNLMVTDPDINGVVSIEPQPDFYQGTNVFTDISEEVDHFEEIEIRPSANEYAKTITYKWKEGTETDAKVFKDKYGHGYGDLSFDQSSFFAKGEQKTELPWATIIPYQVTPNLLVPRFVDIDNTGVKKATGGVPRIMFRNGLKTGAWQLVGATVTNYSTYPSVHHFDDWQAPTFDLNWNLVEELYYTASVVTSVNSFSVYYYQFLNEVINSEGKYVQLYRKMNNLQVANIDWSKLLMWNGALFRFNKVIDFDSEIRESTKIEMLKVLEADSPNRVVTSPGPKLPGLWGKILVGGVGTGTPIVLPTGSSTGAPLLIGGQKNQVLETSKLIQG